MNGTEFQESERVVLYHLVSIHNSISVQLTNIEVKSVVYGSFNLRQNVNPSHLNQDSRLCR
jgi:hypothetical protein